MVQPSKLLKPADICQAFGTTASLTRQTVRTLFSSLAGPTSTVNHRYKKWQRPVHDVGHASSQIAADYGLNDQTNVAKVYFAIQTYYAILIKLIAAEVLTTYRGGRWKSFVERLAGLSGPRLREEFIALEHEGRVFRDRGIKNFCEGTVFSWYVDCWSFDIERDLLSIIEQVRQFEPATSILRPESIGDLWKGLYQNLIPREMRHDFGEYYTPDWLANYILSGIEYDGNLSQRILDPSCGSGTFLLLAIRRLRSTASKGHRSSAQTLTHVTNNIVGFDVNPLAVLAARANYLLAIGDLLRATKEEVEIPIYLGDALFSQKRNGEAEDPFDFIAGNPAWVRWSDLPKTYRKTARHVRNTYDIASTDAWVGGIESDISTVLTYAVADRWLRCGGRLGYAITQSVFKSRSCEGFRTFGLPDGTPLRVDSVDDFVEVRPFEGVQNRASVLFLTKGEATAYPVPYRKWYRDSPRAISEMVPLSEALRLIRSEDRIAFPVSERNNAWITCLPEDRATLQRLIGPSRYKGRKGVTADLNNVYWIRIIRRRGERTVEIRNNLDARATEVRPCHGPIEDAVVHPLVRGQDITAFRWTRSDRYILVPQDGMHGFPEDKMLRDHPLTARYFARYRTRLKERSSYRRYQLRAGAPYYSLWNVGAYTFAPHKVVWREIGLPVQAAVLSQFDDAILGRATPIADHKLMMVPCETAAEAHYLCAVVNSTPIKQLVESFVVNTQVGARIFEEAAIPTFDPANPRHRELSQLSQRLHTGAAKINEDAQAEVDEAIRALF
jgi:hypothetical protein